MNHDDEKSKPAVSTDEAFLAECEERADSHRYGMGERPRGEDSRGAGVSVFDRCPECGELENIDGGCMHDYEPPRGKTELLHKHSEVVELQSSLAASNKALDVAVKALERLASKSSYMWSPPPADLNKCNSENILSAEEALAEIKKLRGGE